MKHEYILTGSYFGYLSVLMVAVTFSGAAKTKTFKIKNAGQNSAVYHSQEKEENLMTVTPVRGELAPSVATRKTPYVLTSSLAL